jgi:hypothetical protein
MTALKNVKSSLLMEDKLNDSAANKLLTFIWIYSLKYAQPG